jgi:hypothetical protein
MLGHAEFTRSISTSTTYGVPQDLLERIGVNRSKTESEVYNGCPA